MIPIHKIIWRIFTSSNNSVNNRPSQATNSSLSSNCHFIISLIRCLSKILRFSYQCPGSISSLQQHKWIDSLSKTFRTLLYDFLFSFYHHHPGKHKSVCYDCCCTFLLSSLQFLKCWNIIIENSYKILYMYYKLEVTF